MSTTINGIPCYPQVAIGRAMKLHTETPEASTYSIDPDWTETEFKAWRIAVNAVDEQLSRMITAHHSPEGAAILHVQRVMLEDPLLESKVFANIFEGHQNVQLALKNAVDDIVALFDGMENDYLRERAADLRDVYGLLIGVLRGAEADHTCHLDEPVVVIARTLTPSQTAGLDPAHVLGIATDLGSCTTHAAIIAQGAGLPSVMGCAGLFARVQSGELVVVDGQQGVVIICPDEAQLEAYRIKQRNLAEHSHRLRAQPRRPVLTSDGAQVRLAVNLSSRTDIAALQELEPDAVGLMRSEFLFLDRTSPPDEDEQASVYGAVAEAMQGRPLTIRTLDAGGDKSPAWLEQTDEDNPALGLRGVRLCLARPALFKTQLRAILRASAFGHVRLLYPMVSTAEELQRCGAMLKQCMQELMARDIPFDRRLEVGVMIETPSAVILAEELARMVDFFSIGTNDLAQYMLAVDRGNTQVAPLYSAFTPAVLRSVRWVADAAHKAGRWCSLCGVLASEARALPLLLGLGVDELSVAPATLEQCAETLRGCDMRDCRALADRVLALPTLAEVEQLLGAPKAAAGGRELDARLVMASS